MTDSASTSLRDTLARLRFTPSSSLSEADLAMVEAALPTIEAIRAPSVRRRVEETITERLDCLHSLTSAHEIQIVREQLQQGLQENYVVNVTVTEFVRAALDGDPDRIQALLDAGCDINVRSSTGRTPLEILIEDGKSFLDEDLFVDEIGFLLQYGARVTDDLVEQIQGPRLRALLEGARLKQVVTESAMMKPRIGRAKSI